MLVFNNLGMDNLAGGGAFKSHLPVSTSAHFGWIRFLR